MVMRTEAPVPPSLRDAASEWTGLVQSVMSHAACVPDRLKAAMEAAPRSATLLAAKGLIFLLLGRRELVAEAKALAGAASEALGEAPSDHDRLMVAALDAWLAGKPSRAAAIFDEIQRVSPADGFAMKMAQAIRFLYGDAVGMRRSAEAALSNFADTHPLAGYAHGCYAFACEETGDLVLAERMGRRALELAPDDAWGLHAVAHVHEMRGHPKAGREWILPRREAFSACSNFANHVWWHLALFELELGEVDSVLALYDEKIRAERTDDYRDIANAVSLLARVEAEGVDVGARWDELSTLAEARVEDGCVVFADLHYLMALLAADRHEAADRLIERMAQAGEATEFDRIATTAGASAGGGLAAMRRGNHDDAFRSLMAARTDLTNIGGSHAQRDVFDRLTIDAALRAGRAEDARSLIKDRAQRRGAYDRFAFERLVKCGPNSVASPVTSAAAF